MARWCAVAGVTLLLLFFYSPRNSPNRATFGLFGAIALATITQTRRQDHE